MPDAESQGEALLASACAKEALASLVPAQRVGQLSLQLLQAVADFKEAHHDQHRPLLLAALRMFALQDAAAPQASPTEDAQV